jgi:hypothetical protein
MRHEVSGPPHREAVGFRDVPRRRRRGSSRRIPLLRNPACGQKEAHRVGLASVQLTRSTFAEATAGRESLQPRALRARCTRKSTGRFGRRQAPRRDNVSQIATIVFLLGFAREIRSTQKHTEAVAPSSDLPTDRRSKRLPVGGPSTSGAPSSVQSGDYGAVHAPSSRNRSRNPQFAIFSLQAAQNCVSTPVLWLNGTKVSPSRVRFRPPPRLTFRFRVRPPGRASS